VKIPETTKQALAEDSDHITKLKERLQQETLTHLASIAERAEYRMKLRLQVHVTIGKLIFLFGKKG
jgi:hypothetical protein